MARLAILVRIALANPVSSFFNVFIGAILVFGAALLVIGGSLFSTLDQSLSRSIVGSVTDHLQVYPARRTRSRSTARSTVPTPRSRRSTTSRASKRSLLGMPNVDKVVPMGACTVLLSAGNTVDITLEKLRALYRDQRGPELPHGLILQIIIILEFAVC